MPAIALDVQQRSLILEGRAFGDGGGGPPIARPAAGNSTIPRLKSTPQRRRTQR